MAKSKKISTLSVSVNQELEVALKGTLNKNFKLNNNRKKIYIYDKPTLEQLFVINVKPVKNETNVYSIELEDVIEDVIVSLNEMSSKFGDIYLIGLNNVYCDIKTSTIVLEKEED